MIWGLNESEWKELKDQQREYNMRNSKILNILNSSPNPYDHKKTDFEITIKEMNDGVD